MAQVAIFKQILDKAEGRTWDANDVGPGDGTHYGCSAGSIKTATGKTVSQDWLKNADYNDPLIQQTIEWYWNKAQVNDLPQDVANIIVDHLYNTGMGRARIIQNTLINRYKADIKDDGIIGAMTTGAIKAAIAKYGEKEVYNAIYAMRYAYYKGWDLPNKSGHTNGKSCTRAICQKVLNTRLNVYYPSKDPINIEDYLKPIDKSGVAKTDVMKQAATASIGSVFQKGNPDRFKNLAVIVLGLTAIFGLGYFLFQMLKKGRGRKKMNYAA